MVVQAATPAAPAAPNKPKPDAISTDQADHAPLTALTADVEQTTTGRVADNAAAGAAKDDSAAATLGAAKDETATLSQGPEKNADTPALAQFTLPPAATGAAHVDAAKADGNGMAPLNVSAPTQQTMPASTNAANPPAPLPVAPVPVAGLAGEIAGRALARKNRFEIRLDPPELGRIEVRLNVAHDGRVTAHMDADRSDTLALLQRDASGLQRALHDAGLKTVDNGLQLSLRDQSGGQQQPMSGAFADRSLAMKRRLPCSPPCRRR